MGKEPAPSSSGTRRLVVAFGAALVGIAFLALALTPLVTGRIELDPTGTDIDRIEDEGFPDAAFLEVRGGNVVFEHADAWLSGPAGEKRLFQLTAPVVSDALLVNWKHSRAAGNPLDLSRLRLVAVFTGDQVATLWPEVRRKAEAGEALDVEPAKLRLVGETVVAKGQLGLPDFPARRAENLHWEKVRRLRYRVHHDSLGRLLRNLALAAVLLAIAFLTFLYHRRHPTRPSPGGLDITPLFDD